MTTTTVKGWRRCRGCLRMRSVLDDRDVCAVCAPRADAGEITLHPAGEVIPTAPVPEPVVADEPLLGVAGFDEVPACFDGCANREPRCADCPNADDAPVAESTPDPKPKPVKRRWWRARRR